MERYLAYFDLLGYKDFILYSNPKVVENAIKKIILAMQESLCRDFKEISEDTFTPDLDTATLRCLNISDTFIFYTDDVSEYSLDEIFKTALRFYDLCSMVIPIRGIISIGEFDFMQRSYQSKSDVSKVFDASMIHGKGLVEAHIKCDLQEWCGIAIDNDLVAHINNLERSDLLGRYSLPYSIPIKPNNKEFAKYAIDPSYYEDKEDKARWAKAHASFLTHVFRNVGNGVLSKEVEAKLNNTLTFFKYIQNLGT